MMYEKIKKYGYNIVVGNNIIFWCKGRGIEIAVTSSKLSI